MGGTTGCGAGGATGCGMGGTTGCGAAGATGCGTVGTTCGDATSGCWLEIGRLTAAAGCGVSGAAAAVCGGGAAAVVWAGAGGSGFLMLSESMSTRTESAGTLIVRTPPPHAFTL